jgi:hypothetical protein
MARGVLSFLALAVVSVIAVAGCDQLTMKADPAESTEPGPPEPALPPPPGDGGIVCPGNKSCPALTRTQGDFGVLYFVPQGTTALRMPYRSTDNPTEVICPYDAAFCPSGFAGRLLRITQYRHASWCVPFATRPEPGCPKPTDRQAFGYVCNDTTKPCPGRPALPGEEP